LVDGLGEAGWEVGECGAGVKDYGVVVGIAGEEGAISRGRGEREGGEGDGKVGVDG